MLAALAASGGKIRLRPACCGHEFLVLEDEERDEVAVRRGPGDVEP